MSTSQTTHTRRVTFVRHVAERAWGRLKQWNILRDTMAMGHVKNVLSMVLVLAAISNAYFPPLQTDSSKARKYSKRILKAIGKTQNPTQHIHNLRGTILTTM